MKSSSTFHISVFFMLVWVCSMPFITLAQRNSVERQAEMDAKRDAETDTNKSSWACLGSAICLSGILGGAVGSTRPQSFSEGRGQLVSDQQSNGFGIGIAAGCLIPGVVAYTYKLKPLPERLIGKSPEYVDFYTSVYRTRAIQLRTRWTAVGFTLAGCGTSLLVTAYFVDWLR